MRPLGQIPPIPAQLTPNPGPGRAALPRRSSVYGKVARVWAYRECVEHEAADQFERMAAGLVALKAESRIVHLAQKAALDEKRHAHLCRQVIAETQPQIALGRPQLGIALGPSDLNLQHQILYACVSLSCITETLSTALLIEMKSQAVPLTIRQTVHSILEDEITHSRIGWAHLANVAKHDDVSWIAAYVPAMIRDAMAADFVPSPVADPELDELSAWGILPLRKAKAIMEQTTREVILPGLKAFGIIVAAP